MSIYRLYELSQTSLKNVSRKFTKGWGSGNGPFISVVAPEVRETFPQSFTTYPVSPTNRLMRHPSLSKAKHPWNDSGKFQGTCTLFSAQKSYHVCLPIPLGPPPPVEYVQYATVPLPLSGSTSPTWLLWPVIKKEARQISIQ